MDVIIILSLPDVIGIILRNNKHYKLYCITPFFNLKILGGFFLGGGGGLYNEINIQLYKLIGFTPLVLFEYLHKLAPNDIPALSIYNKRDSSPLIHDKYNFK